ncbi:uncharacterized protein DEA37_0008306 [Paragonimus westermani]|uniref:U-box domain-containing protein n=1 Tax=Paragonimus westermani TaxID=34504 RepID=A0A5J4NE49_9TREM|nr:uncharacterized protein DEA37_0008306 [Paragonimus westermani]
MFNAANVAFGTTVFCDKPTQDFHSATSLLLPAIDGRNPNGLLCSSIVRPPVNILFCLPKPVDLRTVVIKPDVARHRVTHLSVFLRKDCNKRDRNSGALQVSRPTDIIRRLEQVRPIASVNLDKHPEGSVVLLRTHQKCLLPPCAYLNNARCVYECEVSRDIFMGLSFAETGDSGYSYTNLPRDEEVVNSIVIPEDFVDALTGELMREPVRLPSGNCIDRSSLNRFWTERLVNCPRDPRPVDPFTMVPFDEGFAECDESLKQAISDYLDRCKQLAKLCNRLDNWTQSWIPPTSTIVPQIPTSSESDSD